MNKNPTNIIDRIDLRPVVSPDDEDFLAALYFSTRDDVNALPLEDYQKKAFLEMQYAAKKRHYEQQFPDASHDIILLDGAAVGRIMVARGADDIRIVDIALLPEYRNLGIGTALFENLMEESARSRRILSLHVWKTNRAARLYLRLGFAVTGETATHFKMEREPPETAGQTTE